MTKKSASKASVQKWHQMIGWYVHEHGPVVKGFGAVQFHHVKGRTYKHNKILIGPWFVIPLPWELHDVHSNNEFNVTLWPKRFVAEYGLQSILWEKMVLRIVDYYNELPFDETVMRAIMDTKI